MHPRVGCCLSSAPRGFWFISQITWIRHTQSEPDRRLVPSLSMPPRTPLLVFFLRLHAVCVTHSFASAKRTRGEGHILGIACLSSPGPKEWLPLVCLGNVHSTDHQTNLEGYLVDHVLDEEIGCKLTSCTWESVAMRWEEWIKIESERVLLELFYSWLGSYSTSSSSLVL